MRRMINQVTRACLKVIVYSSKSITLMKALFYKKRAVFLTRTWLCFLSGGKDLRNFPSLLQVEPTNRCQMSCAMCLKGTGDLRRPQADMTLDNFRIVIDQLAHSVMYVSLYNLGEPLLNKDIFAMIQYAKGKNIFTRMSTNGELLNEVNRARLIKSGLDELIVSLDCVDAEQYRKYKKSDAFSQVVANVQALVRERGAGDKPFINLQLLAMRSIVNDLPVYRALVKQLNVDKGLIKKLRAHLPGREAQKHLLPNKEKYVRWFYKDSYKRKKCLLPFISTTILCDGSVVPCCFDMQGVHMFGNTRSEAFESIWSGSRMASFRTDVGQNIGEINICRDCCLECWSEYFMKYL